MRGLFLTLNIRRKGVSLFLLRYSLLCNPCLKKLPEREFFGFVADTDTPKRVQSRPYDLRDLSPRLSDHMSP